MNEQKPWALRFGESLVGGAVVAVRQSQGGGYPPFSLVINPVQRGGEFDPGEGRAWAVGIATSPIDHRQCEVPNNNPVADLGMELANNALAIIQKARSGELDAAVLEHGVGMEATADQLAAAAIVGMCRDAYLRGGLMRGSEDDEA